MKVLLRYYFWTCCWIHCCYVMLSVFHDSACKVKILLQLIVHMCATLYIDYVVIIHCIHEQHLDTLCAIVFCMAQEMQNTWVYLLGEPSSDFPAFLTLWPFYLSGTKFATHLLRKTTYQVRIKLCQPLLNKYQPTFCIYFFCTRKVSSTH